MLITEILKNYDKLSNIDPVNRENRDLFMFHLHFTKKLSARL